MPINLPSLRDHRFVWILLVCTSTGCGAPLALLDDAHSEKPRAIRDERSAIPEDPTPEQLVTLVEDSQKEANELVNMLSAPSQNQSLRLARLQQHVDTGVTAADKLMLNESVSDAQRQSARQSKLFLLCHGARHNSASFRQRLQEYVAELQQRREDDWLSAIGAAVIVELSFLTADEPEEAVMIALVDYAKRYPHCGAGVALLQQYGARLEKNGRTDQAIDCYRTATIFYGHLPEVSPVRNRLISLKQAAAARHSRAQAHRNKIQSIRSQLVGPDDGYYVIYAKEEKSPNSTAALYAFEYEVLHGANAAVAYIAGLKPNWHWELVRHYPDTPTQFAEATALVEELTKKRAFIRY